MAIGLNIDQNNQGIFAVENLVVGGGDTAVKLSGGSLIARVLVSFGSTENAVHVEFPPGGSNGSLRIDEGGLLSFEYFSPPLTPWCGVKIVNGGGHVLKSVTIIGRSGLVPLLPNSIGARFSGPEGVSTTELFDSLIQCETGVLLGDVGEQVFDITVRDCSIFCARDGIKIGDKNSGVCVVSGNTVQVQEQAPVVPNGLTINGEGHRVSDNAIDISNVAPSTPALCAQFGTGVKSAIKLAVTNNVMRGSADGVPTMSVTGCSESTFTGNNVERLSIGGQAVLDADAGSNGNTYAANIVRNPGDPLDVSPAIVIRGDRNAVTGNRTRTAVNVSGIDLTGVTNTAVGNVCENAPPALPVSFVPGNTVGLNAA